MVWNCPDASSERIVVPALSNFNWCPSVSMWLLLAYAPICIYIGSLGANRPPDPVNASLGPPGLPTASVHGPNRPVRMSIGASLSGLAALTELPLEPGGAHPRLPSIC